MKRKSKVISISEVVTGSAMWQPAMIIQIRCRHCGRTAGVELHIAIVDIVHRCNGCGATFGRVPRELKVWAKVLLAVHSANVSKN